MPVNEDMGKLDIEDLYTGSVDLNYQVKKLEDMTIDRTGIRTLLESGSDEDRIYALETLGFENKKKTLKDWMKKEGISPVIDSSMKCIDNKVDYCGNS